MVGSGVYSIEAERGKQSDLADPAGDAHEAGPVTPAVLEARRCWESSVAAAAATAFFSARSSLFIGLESKTLRPDLCPRKANFVLTLFILRAVIKWPDQRRGLFPVAKACAHEQSSTAPRSEG